MTGRRFAEAPARDGGEQKRSHLNIVEREAPADQPAYPISQVAKK